MKWLRYMPFLLVLLAQFLCFCCIRPAYPPEKDTGDARKKKMMEQVNKVLLQKDEEVIENYVKRMGWDMKKTGSGLWYMVYEKGSGTIASTGMKATFSYRVSLLDGTVCYSSDETGPRSFIIGQGGVEPGLEEGILLLRAGDKARFILPPHLAHGLLGDQQRIPARATILYELELKEVSK